MLKTLKDPLGAEGLCFKNHRADIVVGVGGRDAASRLSRRRRDVLLVELVDLAAGLARPVQSLHQQVEGLGRRVVGVLGDLLDLVGVHLVPEGEGEEPGQVRIWKPLLL